MALSQSLQQKLLQKLSPQQIQLMKLLQIPTAHLEERIKEELEENPALGSRRRRKEMKNLRSLKIDDFEEVKKMSMIWKEVKMNMRILILANM